MSILDIKNRKEIGMSTVQEALKAAIEMITILCNGSLDPTGGAYKVVNKCKSALAEIGKCESETSSQPVAYMNDSGFAYAEFKEDLDEYYGKLIPLYTSPQPKEWVGLSDEQLLRYSSSPFTTYHCVKDAEAKLKQLNTGG